MKKKQTKWLDNFGKAENANESNVSLSENFNGLAYDTSYRNYSPAWGGQFQQGGSIPGSVGFTYARTGSTPSEGKYAKKTLPSALNGKEMKFYQEGLDWKPKSMQTGGTERISTSDPRYPELYKNRQVGAYYDGAFTLPDLDQVTVTAPRSYTMQSLRDATSAALYGAPANVMKLSSVPQAAMTEGIEMLRGKPYDFRNVNPNFGGFSSNQRDPSVTMGYENPEGFLQNAANIGLSMIDPSLISGLTRRPIQKGLRQVGQNLKNVRMSVPSEIAEGLQTNGIFDIFKAKPKFQSEIDWSKWNPDTPNYPELINEYNVIEESTKKSGTWMTNPDGSAFQGTPEQFIQQQSSWFKKAFPEGFDQTTRGTSHFFNTQKLDEPLFTSDIRNAVHYTATENPGFWNINKHKIKQPTKVEYSLKPQSKEELELIKEAGKTGDYSKVIQYSTNKALNSNEGGLYQLYSPKSKNSFTIDAKGKEWTNIPYEGKEMPTDFVAEDLFNKNLDYINIENVRDPALGNLKIINPNKINTKSAIGNVGFFDMTNPNIYKGLIPAGIATGLSIEQKRKGGIIKDNQGYWNPDNWGKMVEIDSNEITMKPNPYTGVEVPYDVLAFSNEGDVQYMEPGKDYKFKGSKVTEIPMAKLGINQLDAQPMKKLNQLLNFTNNPDKTNWLDKYQ